MLRLSVVDCENGRAPLATFARRARECVCNCREINAGISRINYRDRTGRMRERGDVRPLVCILVGIELEIRRSSGSTAFPRQVPGQKDLCVREFLPALPPPHVLRCTLYCTSNVDTELFDISLTGSGSSATRREENESASARMRASFQRKKRAARLFVSCLLIIGESANSSRARRPLLISTFVPVECD